MGVALGYPEGRGVPLSLPIADMGTGIVGALTVSSALRDRAPFGGSYQGCTSLTANQALTVSKESDSTSPRS